MRFKVCTHNLFIYSSRPNGNLDFGMHKMQFILSIHHFVSWMGGRWAKWTFHRLEIYFNWTSNFGMLTAFDIWHLAYSIHQWILLDIPDLSKLLYFPNRKIYQIVIVVWFIYPMSNSQHNKSKQKFFISMIFIFLHFFSLFWFYFYSDHLDWISWTLKI